MHQCLEECFTQCLSTSQGCTLILQLVNDHSLYLSFGASSFSLYDVKTINQLLFMVDIVIQRKPVGRIISKLDMSSSLFTSCTSLQWVYCHFGHLYTIENRLTDLKNHSSRGKVEPLYSYYLVIT